MSNNYVSKHSKEPQEETRSSAQRKPAKKKKQNKKSGAIIFLLLAIIFIALAVLAYLAFNVFGFTLPSFGAAATATPEPTVEATAEPTPEPTPEPVYVYSSKYNPLQNDGLFLSPDAFSGKAFFAKASKVADDGFTYIPEIFTVDLNGSASLLPAYKAMSGLTNSENWQNFYSGSELTAITADSNGNPVALECVFVSGSDGKADHYDKHYYARTLDSSGNETASVELFPEETPISGMYFKIDESGNYILLSDVGLAVFSPDGQLLSNANGGGYPSNVVKLTDGKIGLVQWNAEGQTLNILSADYSTFDDSVSLPDSAMLFADGGGEYLFFYSSGVDFMGVRADSGEAEKIFNWSSVDISGSRVSSVGTEDGVSFYCITNKYNENDNTYSSEFASVAAIPEAQAIQKKQLVLASVNPVEDLQDSVAEYNRNQADTRITLMTFDLADTDSGNIEALKAFADSELEGKIPDLIDLTGMPYAELAASGLLEEIGQYLDSDSELSRDSLLPGIRSALEINGKIYGTCSGFNISTVLGPQNVLGNATSWSYDEYNNITRTMGEGVSAFGPYDIQYSLLYDSLGINLSRFVNWDERTCDFDNTDFVKLLEFVKKFPVDIGDDSDTTALETGKQFLKRQTLFTYDDVILAGNEFKKNTTFIGLPTFTGSGNSLNLYKDFAMTKDCSDKQAAWQFLRKFFTENYQSSLWYFPSNANAFSAGLEAAKQIKTDPSGEKIPRASVFADGADPVYYYQLSDAQANALRNLADTSSVNTGNEAIFNIIYEKAAGYLTGNDTAAGAANYVQEAVSAHLAALKAEN
ncbi:MAG: hypothetical protein Q4F31_04460 [Eubacteriales bacterium]|nr:hypothetical protein [Eubacteriales bacterium]